MPAKVFFLDTQACLRNDPIGQQYRVTVPNQPVPFRFSHGVQAIGSIQKRDPGLSGRVARASANTSGFTNRAGENASTRPKTSGYLRAA